MALAHLEKLNPQQRHAVEHGIGARDTRPAGPLLVMAGRSSLPCADCVNLYALPAIHVLDIAAA